jgi:hypothetical protein
MQLLSSSGIKHLSSRQRTVRVSIQCLCPQTNPTLVEMVEDAGAPSMTDKLVSRDRDKHSGYARQLSVETLGKLAQSGTEVRFDDDALADRTIAELWQDDSMAKTLIIMIVEKLRCGDDYMIRLIKDGKCVCSTRRLAS